MRHTKSTVAPSPRADRGPEDRFGPVGARAPRAVALGVLLDGAIQERWALESLRQALAVPGVRLAAVAVARRNHRTSVASRLHRILDRIEARLRCPGGRLFAPADVAAELAAPRVDVEATGPEDGWGLDDAGLAALRRCEADAWLCFASSAPRRPLGRVSRLGVWGLEVGRGVPPTSAWAGAMEVSAGSPVTSVSIVDYQAPRNGLLYRSLGTTIRNSARRNRLNAVRKGMSFFRRLLERLTRGEQAWRSARPATLALPASYPASRGATLPGLARLSWRVASNIVANRWRSLHRLDQWQIAYHFAEGNEPGVRFERLRYLTPPRDRFWADPFAVEHQGRCFIFFEELPYRTRKARIVAIEVFEDAEPGGSQVVLERPYHLSYPFVFAWSGSLYMLPETGQNGTVELYRCETFPDRWRIHKVLLENVSAYDATLCKAGDRWWMFVNIAEPGADSSDELHLYWSASPLGPWTPHRRNPVVSDVRCARPAGPLFSAGGTLYRPAQDCSAAYGHSVWINRVDVLREDDYRETAVERIAPGWRGDILRIHTLGRSERLRVVDCMVSRKRR